MLHGMMWSGGHSREPQKMSWVLGWNDSANILSPALACERKAEWDILGAWLEVVDDTSFPVPAA